MAQRLSGTAGRSAASLRLERVPRSRRRLNQAIGAASAMPRTTDATSATNANRASKAICAPRGRRSAPNAASSRIPPAPTARPSSPPASVSKVVSTTTSLTTYRRLAPKRLPHGHFLHASAGADKKQVRKINGADQEKGEYACLQQQQDGTDRRHVIGVKRHDQRTKAGIGHQFGLADRLLPTWRSAHRFATGPARAWRPALSRAIIWVTFPPECRSEGARSSGRDDSGR